MNDATKRPLRAEERPDKEERRPGWIKGPDGWFYDDQIGEAPPFLLDPGQTYVWIAELDERTCEVCGALHGTFYGESWTHLPPAHPNCRCSIVQI